MYLCTRISKQEYSPIILLSMAQIISVENQTATKQVVETMSSVEHGVILSLQARLLLEKLHNGICHFEFTKVSTQERREAWGTLSQNLISSKVKRSQRRKNPNVIVFWDVEKGGFRSCLISNVTKIY